MKAISLHDPYGTLVAIKAKKWETRSRRTNLRECVAIHVSKSRKSLYLETREPFLSALEMAGIFDNGLNATLGHIVAVAEITECITTTEWIRRYCKTEIDRFWDREYAFGDYSPDRFAWKLENVIRLKQPIPCIGRQFFWNLDEQTSELLIRQMSSQLLEKLREFEEKLLRETEQHDAAS